eukprot:151325-Chlamydomonas_euryale.AAC.13
MTCRDRDLACPRERTWLPSRCCCCCCCCCCCLGCWLGCRAATRPPACFSPRCATCSAQPHPVHAPVVEGAVLRVRRSAARCTTAYMSG